MKTLQLNTLKVAAGLLMALCCISFSGCVYEVPITATPTRKVETKLLGDWVSKDGQNKLKVRKLDDSVYILSVNGQLFRAYHSDVAKTPFASVQEIESPERKYTYVIWSVSEDGKRLNWRALSSKVIPQSIKDPAAVQKLLEKNLKNAELFDDEQEYTKEKP